MQTNVLKAEIVGRVLKNRAVNLQREKKREKETWRVGLVHQPRPTASDTSRGHTGARTEPAPAGTGHRSMAMPSHTHSCCKELSAPLQPGLNLRGHSQGWGEDPSANGAELGGTRRGVGTESSHFWGSFLGSLLLQMAVSASLGAAVQAECGQRMGP